MNETSEAGSFAAAAVQQEGQLLESRQAAQPLTEPQPMDTWAQLAPTGPGSDMQSGGWAPHVWGQADDNSAASFFDQPLQPAADNATEFFDSPQVQQSPAVQWSATDSAHSLQQQDQLRSRVVAADQLAASNDQLTATNLQLTADNQQLTSSNHQLTAVNDQLTASNQQLTISSGQLDAEITGLRERLGASEVQLGELRKLVEGKELDSAGHEAKLAAAGSEAEQLRHQLATMVNNLDAASVTIGELQAEVERLQKSNEVGGEGEFLQQTNPSSTAAVESSTTSASLFSQEGSTAALFGQEQP